MKSKPKVMWGGGRTPLWCPVFFKTMKCKKEIGLVLLSGIFIILYLFTRPFLFFLHGETVLLAIPAPIKAAFSMRFIHSVQKTTVVENLQIDATGTGFMLNSTQYQSFGVGLPFLATEGDFRRVGNYFIIDNMQRKIPKLAVRTGVGTQLTILYQGGEYPLYQKLAAGEKIDLCIAPYYRQFFGFRNNT